MSEKKCHVSLRLPESFINKVKTLMNKFCDLGVKDIGRPDSLTVNNRCAAFRVVIEAGVREMEQAPEGRCDECCRPYTKDNPVSIKIMLLGKETKKCLTCKERLSTVSTIEDKGKDGEEDA